LLSYAVNNAAKADCRAGFDFHFSIFLLSQFKRVSFSVFQLLVSNDIGESPFHFSEIPDAARAKRESEEHGSQHPRMIQF
jgi:hypothetical protein